MMIRISFQYIFSRRTCSSGSAYIYFSCFLVNFHISLICFLCIICFIQYVYDIGSLVSCFSQVSSTIKSLGSINCMIDILSNSYRSNTSTHTARDKRGCDSQGVTDYADTIHDGCTHISLFNILDKTLDPHDERSGIPNGLKDLPVSVNLQDGIPATERIWRKSLLFSRQRVDSVPSCDVRVVGVGHRGGDRGISIGPDGEV